MPNEINVVKDIPVGFCSVTTYTADEENAVEVATHVMETVDGAPAAHVEQIRSLFRWQGELRDEAEWRVSFDIPDNLVERVAEAIRQVHKYELPAITYHDIVPAGEDVRKWLDNFT